MGKKLCNRGGIQLKQLLPAASALVAVAAFIPYLISARYALPFADDFWFYLDFSKYNSDTVFSGAMSMMIGFWWEWQGAYTTTFFNCLLSPLQFSDYSFVIRIELIALLLLGLAALTMFLAALCDYVGCPARYAAYFGCLFLLPLISYVAYTGVYLWYTGAMAYFLPIVFMLPALTLLLFAGLRKRTVCIVLASILAFLTSGCSLEAAGLINGLLLLFVILEFVKDRKPSKPFITVFIIALCGALLNTVAPGNYVRHEEQFGGGFDIIRAVINVLRYSWQRLMWLLGETSFPVFLVLALLLGVYICRKLSWQVLAVCFVGAAVIPVITVFPVILGYNWNGGDISNRSAFLFDAAMMASALTIMILLGSQLSACGRLPDRRIFTIAACALAAAGILLLSGKLNEYKPVAITQNLLNGSIENYSSEWRRIYDYVAEYGEGDVVVTIPKPEETTGCAVAGFTANPENWQNFLLAEYFGVDSVRMTY